MFAVRSLYMPKEVLKTKDIGASPSPFNHVKEPEISCI